MEAYFCAFINWEQNDLVWLLPIAEFIYNNSKNASTGHTPFELNRGYYPRILYKDEANPRSQSKSADELSKKLRELIVVCGNNLYHAQELQKRAHNKRVKSWSYAFSNKVWLNNKFIKIKQNYKLELKFFEPFQIFYPVGKQAYKWKLLGNWGIHNVFHMSLLEQDITRRRREFLVPKFESGDNKKYEVETIQDSTIYPKETDRYLPGLYYLVA